MSQSLFDTDRQSKMRKYFTIFLAACAGFYAILYMPIYYLLSTNIIWVNSPLLLLWMEVVAPLMNYTLYWGSFAFVIYHVCRFGFAKVHYSVAMYALFTAIRYLLGIGSYMSVMGAIHWSEFFANDLFGLLFSIFMDWLQMALLLLITYLLLKRKTKKDPMLAKDGAPSRRWIPVGRLWDLHNPVLLISFLISWVPAVIRVLERLYYDLDLILRLGMKVEGTGEVIVMVSYYVTDLLTIPLGTVVISLVINFFCKLEQKAIAKAEENEGQENE